QFLALSTSNGVAVPCASDVTSQVSVTSGGYRLNRTTGRFVQVLTLTNESAAIIPGPVSMALNYVSPNAAVFGRDGLTLDCGGPAFPYVDVNLGSSGVWAPGASVSVTLEFEDIIRQSIQYT